MGKGEEVITNLKSKQGRKKTGVWKFEFLNRSISDWKF